MTTQQTSIYSIKEASNLTGLPSSTLRYYESIGIISPVGRDESSKHRVYNQEDIDILDAVACLNATGMSLSDMRTYIENRSGGAETANTEIELLKKQQQKLLDDEAHIKVRQKYIALKINYWNAVQTHNDEAARLISQQANEIVKDLKKYNN